MAPYLLLGFLMAGILSQLISRRLVQRHLGTDRWLGSIKAALLGVPMPVCSCGVIPLAAALRKKGASRASIASFLSSTPQTGVDSLMVTYALLGWSFTLFRAFAAFLSGIACGTAVGMVSPPPPSQSAARHDETTDEKVPSTTLQRLRQMFEHSFITLPRDIAKAMLLGLLLSGIISAFVPENFFAERLGQTPWAAGAMLLIGIPIYVCSSASVPLALAFIKAGISPGAVLVFLITGPATNAATLATLWQIIGKKQLTVFLVVLCGCALGAGALMNSFTPTFGILDQVCHTEKPHSGPQAVWPILLLIVLGHALRPAPRGKKRQAGR